jgi:hypothetical protein
MGGDPGGVMVSRHPQDLVKGVSSNGWTPQDFSDTNIGGAGSPQPMRHLATDMPLLRVIRHVIDLTYHFAHK